MRAEPALRLLRILVCALCFLLGAAGGLIAMHLCSPPAQVAELSSKLAALEAQREQVDALFLGSSRVYHGFSPQVFDVAMVENGHSAQSFNLALDGMNFPETDYVLRRALEIGLPKLRVVILEVSPLETTIPAAFRATQRMEYWHDWRHTRPILAWLLERRDYSGAAYHLRLLAQNYAGSGRATRRLDTWLNPHTRPKESHAADDGYAPVNRRISEKEAAQFHTQIAGISGAPREDRHDRQIQQTIDDAVAAIRSAGAKAILVTMPASRRWPKIYDPSTSNIPILEYDDPARFPELYRPEDRSDAAHLNATGAETFSKVLARDIAAMEKQPSSR
jgi:hypothetical protein